jgi:hypothetical protein
VFNDQGCCYDAHRGQRGNPRAQAVSGGQKYQYGQEYAEGKETPTSHHDMHTEDREEESLNERKKRRPELETQCRVLRVIIKPIALEMAERMINDEVPEEHPIHNMMRLIKSLDALVIQGIPAHQQGHEPHQT